MTFFTISTHIIQVYLFNIISHYPSYVQVKVPRAVASFRYFLINWEKCPEWSSI